MPIFCDAPHFIFPTYYDREKERQRWPILTQCLCPFFCCLPINRNVYVSLYCCLMTENSSKFSVVFFICSFFGHVLIQAMGLYFNSSLCLLWTPGKCFVLLFVFILFPTEHEREMLSVVIEWHPQQTKNSLPLASRYFGCKQHQQHFGYMASEQL